MPTHAIPLTNAPEVARMLTWVDVTIAGVLVFSSVVSLIRGFTKELLSLLTWVLAIWIATAFSGDLSRLLVNTIQQPTARTMASYLTLFLSTLFVGGMTNLIIGKILRKTGLSPTDRLLGMFFGLARGVAVVTIVILLLGLTPFPSDPLWKHSTLVPAFQALAIWLRDFLPENIAAFFIFPAS